MTSRPSTAAIPVLAVLAILLAMLGAYVGGYFLLGEVAYWPNGGNEWTMVREYSRNWQARAFKPAGQLESVIRDTPVVIWSTELEDFSEH